MIFYSHGNEVHFYKQVLPLSLTVKVRVSGSSKWPKTRHILIRKKNKGNKINKFVKSYYHIYAHRGPFLKSPGNYWAMKAVLFALTVLQKIFLKNGNSFTHRTLRNS